MKRFNKFLLKTRVLLVALPVIFAGICPVGTYALESEAEDVLYEGYVYDPSTFDPLDCTPLSQCVETAEENATENYGSNVPLDVPDSEYYWRSFFGKSSETMIAEYEAVVSNILAGIKPYWTDEQKLFYLHDYIVLNSEYDYDQANSLDYTTYGINPVSQSAYGNLVLHLSVCDGYARAFYDLANRAGIEAYDVLGMNGSHAWNLVKLDGRFYYVDCTWDDGTGDTVRHTNFLSSQSKMVETGHTYSDWKLTPYYNIGFKYDQLIYGKFNNKKYDNACWKNTVSKVMLFNGYSVYYSGRSLYKYYGDPNQGTLIAETSGYNGTMVDAGDDIVVTDGPVISAFDTNTNQFIDIYVAKEKYLDTSNKYYYRINTTSLVDGYLYFELRRYEYGKSYSGLSDDIVRAGRVNLNNKESYFAPVYDETYFLNNLKRYGLAYTKFDNAFYVKRTILNSTITESYGSPLEYFIKVGMQMGYRGSERFDLAAYKKNNPDLVGAYGDNNSSYYFHYLDCGKNEGRVAKPDTVAPAGTSLMHRMYNPNSGEHFYTGDNVERTNLIIAGWNYEGDAWFSPTVSSEPVYRLYNPNAGDHHYTLDSHERDSLVRVGWIYENVAWYSASKETGKPVYRLYNPNAVSGAHHYTMDAAERDALVRIGWIYEDIGWYAE